MPWWLLTLHRLMAAAIAVTVPLVVYQITGGVEAWSFALGIALALGWYYVLPSVL